MPKKKKSGLSPGRGSAQPGEGAGRRAAPRIPSPEPGAHEPGARSTEEAAVRSLQEMFSHLDPGVIYIVLSEADFKVENAMDALLELSDAAEGKALSSPTLSGFEMAAALLDRQPHSDQREPVSVEPWRNHSPETTHLTEEFDSLIDQELEFLTSQNHPDQQPALSSIPLSPLLSQTTDPGHPAISELEQLDVELETLSSNSRCQRASPVNEQSFRGGSCPKDSTVSADFSYLTEDSSCRHSAFKTYCRPDRFMNRVDLMDHPETLHTPAMFWNFQAPEFHPRVGGPGFTPVTKPTKPWTDHHFTAAQWLTSRPVSQAPVKPSATLPKSWTLPSSRLILDGPVLVLLRGAPGSGKSTLASAMLEQNPGGVALSTDEYFTQNGTYHYKPDLLGEAHAWNHIRAKEAFEKGYSPIIIDNTNMQCWEMKPYVALALKHKYRVLFREPDTWWKTKPRELAKRTTHGVTSEKIRRMLEQKDRFVSVQNIMASQPKSTAVFGVDVNVPKSDTTQQPLPVGLRFPDLVGDSGFGGQLSFSLPDISASQESVSAQNTEKLTGTTESELLVGANVDWHLDGCISSPGSPGLETSEDHSLNPDVLQKKVLEQTVPFSESICQRVRREREQSRFAKEENASQCLNVELVSDSLVKATQEDGAEEHGTVKPELQNFVGDWPSESLEQRGQRHRKSDTQTLKHLDEETVSHVEDRHFPDNRPDLHSDCYSQSRTEVQNVLDLLQGKDNFQEIAESSLSLVKEPHPWSSVGTEAPKRLPDWKFGRFADPDKANSQPRSPRHKELTTEETVDERGPKEAGAQMRATPNDGISVGLEVMDKSSFTSDTSAEGIKDKRKGSGRRAGKSCRLALTFTSKSPPSACLLTGSDLPQPQLKPRLETRLCASVQTDPQDFSLLWRINQNCCDLDSSTSGIVVLKGDPLRFVPKTNGETNSSQHQVPYRVCHEKGSQVEESDLRELPFKQHSLKILSHHFKHVPVESLEDLYEKCHQDMDWTTNLLLDSGEQLYRDDNDEEQFAEDDLGSLVPEEEDLDREQSCANQMTWPSPEEQKEQASDEIVVPDTSGNISTVSADARDLEDNVRLEKSEPSQTSENDDQKKHLELENDAVAILKCTSRSANPNPNPNTDQSRAQWDPSGSKSESQLVPVQDLTSVSEREVFDQYFDGGLEWFEEEVQLGKEEKLTKEEFDAITQSLLAQAEDLESRKEREKERENQAGNGPLNIQILELKLPTELALQLTELFGPVGINPGEVSADDCSVMMDLNFAKLLHQKWKETIQERHRQVALSYHLQQQNGYSSLSSQSNIQEGFPFMDHWNVSCPPVSLRNIMIEEQVMQESLKKSRLSRWDLDKKDGAAILKENQLFTLFPTIDRHFLRDIFRDHNYSLEQTEQFLRTLLDDGPVKNVVAAEVASERFERAPSKERRRKQKTEEPDVIHFQDTEDPEYEDFRTEALLQRRRQQDCFSKAAEAHRQGRKDVASFYAQQGHLHGQKMREANHRAAVKIFERVNATLLPQNILDLHGLHVDESLHHLQKILADKTSEWQQGLCSPQLSVITGRGNHSQGGVARIRPAVLDYLKNQHYRYSEPKLGLIIVNLH